MSIQPRKNSTKEVGGGLYTSREEAAAVTQEPASSSERRGRMDQCSERSRIRIEEPAGRLGEYRSSAISRSLEVMVEYGWSRLEEHDRWRRYAQGCVTIRADAKCRPT